MPAAGERATVAMTPCIELNDDVHQLKFDVYGFYYAEPGSITLTASIITEQGHHAKIVFNSTARTSSVRFEVDNSGSQSFSSYIPAGWFAFTHYSSPYEGFLGARFWEYPSSFPLVGITPGDHAIAKIEVTVERTSGTATALRLDNVYIDNGASLGNCVLPDAPIAAKVATGPGRGQVTLSWAPPLHNGGAEVTEYRVNAAGSSWTYENITSARSIIIGGLADAENATFTVNGRNRIGEGPPSIPATGSAPRLPSAPSDLQVEESQPTYVWFAWRPPADKGGVAVYYEVYTRNVTGPESLHVSTSKDYAATRHENPELRYFRVRAVNVVGVSDFSNEICVIGSPRDTNVWSVYRNVDDICPTVAQS